MLKLNEIYNMDCLDGMKMMDDCSVDCVVTDPPYKIIGGGCRLKDQGDECSGVLNRRRDNKRTDWVDEVRSGKMFKENDIKFSDWIPSIYRILKEGTHFYVMSNDRNIQELLNVCTENKFKLVNVLIWKKDNCTPNKYYMKNCEFILMFRKGSARNINNMGTKQCLEVKNIIGGKIHPTEKPTPLMKILVENSTNESELVLDPFTGSGSTLVACQELNRNYIGFELDETYYNVAKDRINKIINKEEAK